MVELSKYKLLNRINSIKRFKDFRNIEKIEYIEPFLRKKNVKFLKRNRFINFLYTYSFSVRKLNWNRKNQTSYLRELKNEITSFIEQRVFQHNLLNDFTEIERLIHFKNIFSRYIQFRMNTLLEFYNNEVKSKETFFNDNFPQDMISPHRKRRVMTYIKRFTITGRKLPSYLIFKSDLLYILTSRKKMKEVLICDSEIIDKNKLKLVGKKNKKYYNQTLNEINNWLMRRISCILNTTAYNHDIYFKLNNVHISNINEPILLGDCVEIVPHDTLEEYKLQIIFQLFKLSLYFRKKKKIVLKHILCTHLFLICYNTSINRLFKYNHELLQNQYSIEMKKNILHNLYNKCFNNNIWYAQSNAKIIPFQFGWIGKYNILNKYNNSLL